VSFLSNGWTILLHACILRAANTWEKGDHGWSQLTQEPGKVYKVKFQLLDSMILRISMILYKTFIIGTGVLNWNCCPVMHVLAISSVGLPWVSCYVFTCVCVFSFFLSFFLLYISVIQSVLLPCPSVHKGLYTELARSNSVMMICIPPHTTHKIQPLDRAAYGPLKVNCNSECDNWMTMHAGRRISQYDQAELFGRAYVRTATMEKALSSFSKIHTKSHSMAPHYFLSC